MYKLIFARGRWVKILTVADTHNPKATQGNREGAAGGDADRKILALPPVSGAFFEIVST
jgi:hypothetical protein